MSMKTDKHVVECYSGSTYAERPVVVHWQGQRLAVEHVLRSWRTPVGIGFDVIVYGGHTLVLDYCEANDSWTVVVKQ